MGWAEWMVDGRVAWEAVCSSLTPTLMHSLTGQAGWAIPYASLLGLVCSHEAHSPDPGPDTRVSGWTMVALECSLVRPLYPTGHTSLPPSGVLREERGAIGRAFEQRPHNDPLLLKSGSKRGSSSPG